MCLCITLTQEMESFEISIKNVICFHFHNFFSTCALLSLVSHTYYNFPYLVNFMKYLIKLHG